MSLQAKALNKAKVLFQGVIFTFLLINLGCSKGDNSKSELLKTLGLDQQQVSDFLSQNTEIPKEELKKLRQWEYQTVDLSRSDSRAIDSELNKLGRERWECFHVIELETKLRFFCKRKPYSPLQYIPRTVLAR